jgi:pimeloyl-ACP methyl ester carboxylesterase
VVHGDDDPLVPPINARWLARRIPDAKLHVVRGAGHLLLIDEPAKVVGRINHFLAS